VEYPRPLRGAPAALRRPTRPAPSPGGALPRILMYSRRPQCPVRSRSAPGGHGADRGDRPVLPGPGARGAGPCRRWNRGSGASARDRLPGTW